MKINKKPLAIATICNWQSRIDEQPDYQRPPAWSRRQKQLLIDSILRDYDIPKMYWRATDRPGFRYEVIDGQQRLRTIWEFRNSAFGLPRDADTLKGQAVGGLCYADLPLDICADFDSYTVDVVIIEDAARSEDEDEIRDMFLRLQNGSTLKAQEKRNAMPGAMRTFVKALSAHPFLSHCRFANTRFAFDHIVAQAVRLELEGGPANLKDAELNRMYEENRGFDATGAKARKVRKVFDFLLQAFPVKTPELERYSVITLYCLASKLVEGYVSEGLAGRLHDWFIAFETERRAQEGLADEDKDVALLEYRRLISQSTDAEESVRARLEVMERRFFEAFPKIEPRDPRRDFSHEQRLAIFRRDGGECQVRLKCSGDKVAWGDWHADHRTPHVRGGKTTVANGQVACAACNLAKSGSALSALAASA